MTMVARVASASVVLAVLAASSLAAQLPARVVLERDHITLEPGDIAHIEATVVDADGNPVDAELMYSYLGRRTRGLDIDSRTGALLAVKGGEYRAVVHVFDERFFEQISLPELFEMMAVMTITVPYPPVERVDVSPAEGGTFYAGTVVRHEATVYDVVGDLRTNVEVGWSTSDASVATIDRYGMFSAHAPGQVTLTASAERVVEEVVYNVVASPVTSISLTASQEVGRTGDVVRFAATAMAGDEASDIPVTYSIVPYADRQATADFPPAEIDPRGRFVAYRPGVYTVMATVPGHSAHETVRIEPRNVGEAVRFVGHAPVRDVRTSDLWVWEGVDGHDYAITGTWSAGGATYWWDVTDPADPVLVDSLVVDARTTNDVKVSEDGRICVISREGASDRRNGIVIVDCSDPSNVEILSIFDDGLTGGVHNVFIHEGHVYAVNRGSRFDVINIEDPANPYRVSDFRLPTDGREISDYEGTHDIWVVDGVAYTSNWGDGVAVIDVGGGDRGGCPSNPVLMYRFGDVGGSHPRGLPVLEPDRAFLHPHGRRDRGDELQRRRADPDASVHGRLHPRRRLHGSGPSGGDRALRRAGRGLTQHVDRRRPALRSLLQRRHARHRHLGRTQGEPRPAGARHRPLRGQRSRRLHPQCAVHLGRTGPQGTPVHGRETFGAMGGEARARADAGPLSDSPGFAPVSICANPRFAQLIHARRTTRRLES